MKMLQALSTAASLLVMAVTPLSAALLPCCCPGGPPTERTTANCCQADASGDADDGEFSGAGRLVFDQAACCADRQSDVGPSAHPQIRSLGCCCFEAAAAIPVSQERATPPRLPPTVAGAELVWESWQFPPLDLPLLPEPVQASPTGPPLLALHCTWLK